MGLPANIDLGYGVLHLDVLRAKLAARSGQMYLALVSVCVLITIGAIVIRVVFGTPSNGYLVVTNPGAAVALAIDQVPLAPDTAVAEVSAGSYQLSVAQDGFYAAALPLVITAAQTTTVTLPALRPRPTVQEIPLPASGAQWSTVGTAPGGGWRAYARFDRPVLTPEPGSAVAPLALTTDVALHIDASGVSRLSALEAYPAADELIIAAGRYWASWEPNQLNQSGSTQGVLEIATPSGATALPLAYPVTGLWWSPGATYLLLSQQQGSGTVFSTWVTDVDVAGVAISPPQLTVPGSVAGVHWQAEEQAALIISSRSADESGVALAAPTYDATLYLPRTPIETSRGVSLGAVDRTSHQLPMFAWDREGLWWVRGQNLDYIPFAAALPRPVGALPPNMVALRVSDDRQILVATYQQGRLSLLDYPSLTTVVVVDDITALPADTVGSWDDTSLLLSSAQRLWEVSFARATLAPS